MRSWNTQKRDKTYMSKIGIVILNYINWKVTAKCIQSIMASAHSSPLTIIVIDNGSNNNSIEHIKASVSKYDEIIYLQIEQNIGFANGNNVGLQWCEKHDLDYCLFINSDIIVHDNCVDVLHGVFHKVNDAVVVGPQILDINHNLTESSLIKKTRFIDALGILKWFKPKRIDESKVNNVERVYSVSGCCFMVDVKRFVEIGMFDKNTFLYNEENILAELVHRSNYSEYFTSETYVIHEHAASSGGKNDFVYTELLKSTLYYWKQYRRYNRFSLLLILFAWFLKMEVVKFKGNDVHPRKILHIGISYMRSLFK